MLLVSTISLICLFLTPQIPLNQAEIQTVHPQTWRLLGTCGDCIKVWVFFTDKGFSSESATRAALDELEAEYDPRAIARRALRGHAAQRGGSLFSERDLPVYQQYIDEVTRTGATFCVQSRWLNAISVHADRRQIRQIATLNCVKLIQPVAYSVGVEPLDNATPTNRPNPPGDGLRDEPFHGLSYGQLTQINLVTMHDQGYTGSGVIIGVLDTGFARFHEALTHPDHPIDVLAEWDFVADDPNTGYDPSDPYIPDPHGDRYQHAHGTIVLGTIAGYMPGVFIGGAYDASFILAKTEDISDEYPAEEDLYVAGLEFIEANGADIATSSLGYHNWYDWEDMDGLTAVTTIAVNIATDNGLICCTAAGNGARDGDVPSLIAPGDAFDVITCGAVNPSGVLADFSSGGPTFDGRVKPEVLAQGEFTVSIDALVADAYGEEDGTSMSTPLVASAVACILQAHPCWGIEQIRANLFATASDYVINGQPDPMFARGYGIVDAYQAAFDGACVGDLNEDGTVNLEDLAQLLSNYGATAEMTYPDGDLDCDSDIDLSDLAGLLAGYGTYCP